MRPGLCLAQYARMDAIKLIKQQHAQVDGLFKEFEGSDSKAEKQALFEQIADDLAIHATIEERFFYPVLRMRQTEQEIRRSLR